MKKPIGLASSAQSVGIGAFLVEFVPVFGALVGIVTVALGILALREQQAQEIVVTGIVFGLTANELTDASLHAVLRHRHGIAITTGRRQVRAPRPQPLL